MECPRATERLRVQLPSTMTDASGPGLCTPSYNPPPSTRPQSIPHHPSHISNGGASGQNVLAATESFITLLDALKLNMLSKDQLHPLLAELIQSVNKVTEQDFAGRGAIIKWLIRLNGMRAVEELAEGEARELGAEIEEAYRGFKGVLS